MLAGEVAVVVVQLVGHGERHLDGVIGQRPHLGDFQGVKASAVPRLRAAHGAGQERSRDLVRIGRFGGRHQCALK
ncbi:hypothetical protein [Microbacterium elymi]|uniref:Uncharacterized protein n=1 Tax=Microbacterium elymi TaxID=2909587 RepID=A0ABY5NNW9_9MICO|nr:hypothetical protein [Microbacterium elymi]UUT36746.1 hypothetical protein L2X98_32620 [Microbacterium elymi]